MELAGTIEITHQYVEKHGGTATIKITLKMTHVGLADWDWRLDDAAGRNILYGGGEFVQSAEKYVEMSDLLRINYTFIARVYNRDDANVVDIVEKNFDVS